MNRGHKHAYIVLGGVGGWELLECVRCGRESIPSPFGFMWPNLRILQWVNPTLRCIPKGQSIMAFGRRWHGNRDWPAGFENTPLAGVPSLFTGEDTTYGEVRRMALETRDIAFDTQAEKGLAIVVLALLDELAAQHERKAS